MPQKEKLLICLREVLSFHRPRHGRINSKPKKVIYGTLYHLASKKEDQFLNTIEDFYLGMCKDKEYVLLDVKSFRSETINQIGCVGVFVKTNSGVFYFFVANFVC